MSHAIILCFWYYSDSMKALEYLFKFIVASRIKHLQTAQVTAEEDAVCYSKIGSKYLIIKYRNSKRWSARRLHHSTNWCPRRQVAWLPRKQSRWRTSRVSSMTYARSTTSSINSSLNTITPANNFNNSELADLACTLANSIPYDEAKKQLSIEKLGFLHELVAGSFYRDTGNAPLIKTNSRRHSILKTDTLI